MTTQAERRTAAGPASPAPAAASLGVVVVTFDNEEHLGRLLRSLRREAAATAMRVVVVDNGSSDATVGVARAHADVVTVAGHGNLGYAGGINVGIERLDDVDAVLVLNADLVVEPGAVAALVARLARPEVGVVLPLLLDEEGAVQPSLRREPSVTRALGDAVLGRFFGDRPAWLAETVRDPTAYAWPHPVDWGTGAAMLLRTATLRDVGGWDERFFLYSEETDYCRRVRQAGWEVWFEPAARVRHAEGGSGRSPELTALLQVNRVRYARKHGSAAAAGATLAVTTLGSLARAWDPGHRSAVAALVVPARRRSLPRGRPATPDAGTAARDTAPELPSSRAAVPRTGLRGTVIVPAHDEARVLARTLAPIAPWARQAGVEVVVVCNGCTDGTADVARRFPGVRVLELAESSKTRALNAGDAAADAFPRVYLDADVLAEPAALDATLRALADGPWLAARPPAELDMTGATAPVRAYARARARLPATRTALWGAGVYGLSAAGHDRLGAFPDVVADDLWVDRLFRPAEKRVVDAPPVRVAGPRTVPSLLAVLRRTYRGNAAVGAAAAGPSAGSPSSGSPSSGSPSSGSPSSGSPSAGSPSSGTPSSGSPSAGDPGSGTAGTARALLGTVRDPRSALDAAVYATLVALGRVQRRDRTGRRWERDESTRR